MSIALDVALYLRENSELHKELTLSDRAVLFTLAFRVGSNPYCWISQEELSKELNINDRNVRKHTSKLRESGLILITQCSKDKRKNSYRPSENLINYHQKNRSKSTGNYPNPVKNTGQNRPVLIADTGQNRPVLIADTGQNRPVFNVKCDSQDNESNKEFSEENGPKVTYKSKGTYKSKETNEKDIAHEKRELDFSPPKKVSQETEKESIILPTHINEDVWSDFLQHRKSIKSPMSLMAQKKALKVLEKFKEDGYDIEEIINNSIVNGWKGLFPLTNKNGPKGNFLTKEQKEEKYGKFADCYDDYGKFDTVKGIRRHYELYGNGYTF